MYPLLLKISLLFAVATSQIFGGISCCCLGRAVCSVFLHDDADSQAVQSDAEGRATTKRPSSSCPKCRTRTSGPVVVETSEHGKPSCNRSFASEDNQCRCVKPTINASNPTEPASFQFDAQFAVADEPIGKIHRKVDKPLSRDYAVPIRFGGHSWQSIACVWKN